MTSVRSSGENTTVRTRPSSSRALGNVERLTRARLDLPGLSSTSSTALRPSRTTAARMIACSAPARTRGASEETRWEPSRER